MPTRAVTYVNNSSTTLKQVRKGTVEYPRPANGVYKGVYNYESTNLRYSGDRTHQTGSPPAIQNVVITSDYVNHIDPGVRWALDKARMNFIRKVSGESAEIGISVVQWRESLGMISNRAKTLGSFAKKIPGASLVLVTGDYWRRRKALDSLRRSLRAPANSAEFRRLTRRTEAEWRRRIRSPGDLFLEFWFGWSPLVNDMYTAATILSEPPKESTKVVGTGHELVQWTVGKNPPGNGEVYRNGRCGVSAGVFARVSVTNPNLHLANRLGLVNPAAIALDAIPFSWLANWFVNIQQFTRSLSWEAGVTLESGSVGYGWRETTNISGAYRVYGDSKKRVYRGTVKGFRQFRVKGVPGGSWQPKLRLQPPTGSVTRALTALSLLLQRVSRF